MNLLTCNVYTFVPKIIVGVWTLLFDSQTFLVVGIPVTSN